MNRVASLNERLILEKPDFLEELCDLESELGLDPGSALQTATDCLDELAVRPENRYLDWVARLARFMCSRSYDPELDINQDQLDRLKRRAGKQPMVFLWSHKSHLDSFVFMRAMYDSQFIPQPLSFAGINMNFVGFGTLARKSGAIFVRRSFSDDPIYKMVFRHYIEYLVQERVPLSWSIEGTRSRTGKLMPPRLGLINWVVDAYRRAACDDALLVPVSISFDQIPEIGDYVAMQQGLPKRKESLKWFIDYIGGMKSHFGKIYVRFAEPIAIREALSASADVSLALLGDPSRPDRVQVQKLAFEVSNRIENATPIKSTDLIMLVLLAANGQSLSRSTIEKRVAEIMAIVEQRQLPSAGPLQFDAHNPLALTLATLVRTGLLRCEETPIEERFHISEGQQLAAAYYRNTVVHYFLNSAIAELADTLETSAAFEERALGLRDLLKFEFFFCTKPEFMVELEQYREDRKNQPPLFGHAILRSFIEAYWVLSRVLLETSHKAYSEEDPSRLTQRCLQAGEALLTAGKIHSETALSLPIFESAARLASHRGLLNGKPGEQDQGRNQFALEMDQALQGINRLQSLYDSAHG